MHLLRSKSKLFYNIYHKNSFTNKIIRTWKCPNTDYFYFLNKLKNHIAAAPIITINKREPTISFDFFSLNLSIAASNIDEIIVNIISNSLVIKPERIRKYISYIINGNTTVLICIADIHFPKKADKLIAEPKTAMLTLSPSAMITHSLSS